MEGMCAGYQSGTYEDGRPKIMVCVSGCDGTYFCSCVNSECDWFFADPWNRGETRRQHWQFTDLVPEGYTLDQISPASVWLGVPMGEAPSWHKEYLEWQGIDG